MSNEPETTLAWQEYQSGIDYKNVINLYTTVDRNERFFAGDQWIGVEASNLPKPVVNFIKYASAWKIAAVTENNLKMLFFPMGDDGSDDERIYVKQLNDYVAMLWERLYMDYTTKEGLKDAALSGDMIMYFYWDDTLPTGQALKGDINVQLVDGVNFYPGNPNTPDIQSQPYLLVVSRELVEDVRAEAKKNDVKKEQIELITHDSDTEYTAGDYGKHELEDKSKCNVIMKFWREDGKVFYEKSTRHVVVQEKTDTKLTKYPFAHMNWDTRKNSFHGTAEVTALIPNQVFLNKMLAFLQLHQMQMSFPKVIYDGSRIDEWTNEIDGAIEVNGDVMNAVQFVTPPQLGYDVTRGFDTTLAQTMKMMGANDVVLGNVSNPDNTSAIIATRDAAMVPLQTHRQRFYRCVEDIGHVWIDFIKAYYKGGRKIPVRTKVKKIINGMEAEIDGISYVPLPEDALNRITLNVRVEVGPSSSLSEIQTIQTLDNLLERQQITFEQYLQRMPDGQIPQKEELLQEVRAFRLQQEQMQQMAMMQEMGGQPPVNNPGIPPG